MNFYMLIGLPGVGKSTYVTNIKKKEEDIVVLSFDDYIEKMAAQLNSSYSKIFTNHVEAAETNLQTTLNEAISKQKDIIWDQTNLSIKSRRKKLAKIPDSYFKIAIYFEKPEDKEWERRLASRPGKVIPDYVLESMKKSLEIPTKKEGFNLIIMVDREDNRV